MPDDEDFIIDEVWMKDGELRVHTIGEADGGFTFRFCPIDENTFGRKGGYPELKFGDGFMMMDDIACRKL